ncbi:MAG: 5-formyltetrahydrofolate cyclo-ligase [Chitinophagaceae bacterium]
MTKKELRKIYRGKRDQLSPADLNRMHDLLLINFQQYPMGVSEFILSFQPITERKEFNTHLLIDYLLFRIPTLRVAYPVIDDLTNTFQAIEVDEETEYQLNHYGISEPLHGQVIDAYEIDAVFIPLLAFDNSGYRVGYGKGYYDRYLENCRPDVLKIGFSYFEPVSAIDDINEYDVPLNVCITPNRLYEF